MPDQDDRDATDKGSVSEHQERYAPPSHGAEKEEHLLCSVQAGIGVFVQRRKFGVQFFNVMQYLLQRDLRFAVQGTALLLSEVCFRKLGEKSHQFARPVKFLGSARSDAQPAMRVLDASFTNGQ